MFYTIRRKVPAWAGSTHFGRTVRESPVIWEEERMKRWMLGLAMLVLLVGLREVEGAVTIDFDTDPYGNPIDAPRSFGSTPSLTTLYAPLGVTFAGPGGNEVK